MNAHALALEDFPAADLLTEPRRTAPPAAKPAFRAPAPQAAPTPSGDPVQRRGKRWLWITLAVLGAITVSIALGLYLQHAAKFEETDNAFVEADVHPISGRIAGDVVAVLVNDNQVVTQGQPLLRLDSRDLEVNLQSAKAALAQSTAQVSQSEAARAQAQAALRQAEAQITTTAAQMEKARLDFGRAEALFRIEGKAISQQDFDGAKAAYDVAKSMANSVTAARDAAVAFVGTAEANVIAAQAGSDHAQSAVEAATLQLSYTTLVAPSAGRIAKKTVETGQHVQPGQALMAVVSTEQWIVANFKENQLSEMRPHQEVEVTIDAIHGHAFKGHVESFAPGTGAKFSLLPPDNATGNFTKIVQRVPIKILLDAQDLKTFEGRIAPGLSAIATVRVKE